MDSSNGKETSACFSGAGIQAGRRIWCRRTRLGLLFIIIGTLWLMVRVGWLAGDLFFPLTLIIIGLWISVPSEKQIRKNYQETAISGHRPGGSPEIPQ
jgi:hypothetical protein